MKTRFKKNIARSICIIVIINIVTVYLLFKNRRFSHLAIWDVLESDKEEDFYWPPEKAPAYFRLETDSDKISGFRKETLPLVKNEGDEFKIILEVARYVLDIKVSSPKPQVSSLKLQTLGLRWDSPEGMLRQVKQGAAANCFHRAILFSTYLSSVAIKSRLWALENDNFNTTAHSINEVYINALKKWVFIDVMFGLYVTENGVPLSFLEFRERLLSSNSNKISVQGVHNEVNIKDIVPVFYSRLIKCVFLRANNDFVNTYNHRYGIFSFAQDYIDRLPDNIRRGLGYLLEGQKFIHYVDRFSKSLRMEIILTKLFLYFLVFSSAGIGIFAAGKSLKICFIYLLNNPYSFFYSFHLVIL